MKTFLKTLVPLSILALSAPLSLAQAVSETVGFNKVTCLPNSDTIVSAPLMDTTDSFGGTVTGTPTLTGTAPENIATFTVLNVANLTVNKYQNMFYVQFTSGQLDGQSFQVSANTASTLSIKLEGEDGNKISATDTFKVCKFWTLDTLFPDGNTTIVNSLGQLGFQHRTYVLMFDYGATGINNPAPKTFYRTAAGWFDIANADANNEIIWPGSPIVIRHPQTVAASTTYVCSGEVHSDAQVIPLFTSNSGERDNTVSIQRPIPVKLEDLNLIANNAFTPSPSQLGFQRKDTLKIFDNTDAKLNKPASQTYYYYDGNWYNSSNALSNDVEIKPSEGLIIRKSQTNDGATHFWKLPKLSTP